MYEKAQQTAVHTNRMYNGVIIDACTECICRG